MLYDRRFFRNKQKAVEFCERSNGSLLCAEPESYTCKDYQFEALDAGLDANEQQRHPFCVVWNIVEEGPIQREKIIEGDLT